MKNTFLNATRLTIPPNLIFLSLFVFIFMSCQKQMSDRGTEASLQARDSELKKDPQSLKDFVQVNLVANNSEYQAMRIDANLVNAWGISFPTSGPAWVSSAGTGLSFIFTGDGTQPRIPVIIPGAGASPRGVPTGQVFNAAPGFRLPNGNPARFIFATADGTISGWNGGNNAIKKVDDSPDAAYLGLAIAKDGPNTFLYAANFSEGKISVYDTAWVEVNKTFVDPDLPAGYSPFNIQNVDGKLYVMYAKVGPDGEETRHPGFGIVDIFNPDGSFVKRFVTYGQLNAPWGIAHAPAEFWGVGSEMPDAILIGNFGDGHINAYNMNGDFLGQLRAHGNPIEIEGLWGIAFAPSTSTALNHNWLFFAAGPKDETDGLFGYIKK